MKQLKKKTVLVILTIVLVGAFAACASDTTLEDYLEFEAEFFALHNETNRTRTAEIRFELLGIEDAVLYVTDTLILADGVDETAQLFHIRDQDGEYISELELRITDGKFFMSIDSLLPALLHSFFGAGEGAMALEFLGISRDDMTVENIFGDSYTHIQFSDNMMLGMDEDFQEWWDSWVGLYEAFTEEELESYLSRSNDVFRIEVHGEYIEPFIDALLEELSLESLNLMLFPLTGISDIGDYFLAELDDDFPRWLRDSDLADAWFVVERSKQSANTYSQNIELYIPERVSIIMEATIVVGESPPISAPSRVLTEHEFESRLEIWIMNLLFANGTQNPELVGTWVWSDGDNFAYVFEADGRGSRGFIGETYTFSWETTADGILVLRDGPFSEHWMYMIHDDVLTISSLDTPGMVFSYIRVE